MKLTKKEDGQRSTSITKLIKPAIPQKLFCTLKKRLNITGDYKGEDTSLSYLLPQLEIALKHAQQRFGLNADGELGAKTAKELNIPVKSRIEQILVNMERLKWMPNESSGTRLVANIPEFRFM